MHFRDGRSTSKSKTFKIVDQISQVLHRAGYFHFGCIHFLVACFRAGHSINRILTVSTSPIAYDSFPYDLPSISQSCTSARIYACKVGHRILSGKDSLAGVLCHDNALDDGYTIHRRVEGRNIWREVKQ